MPLTYEQDSRFSVLAPVLDEHAEWFNRVVRQVFYPEKKLNDDLLAVPDSFDNWAAQAGKDETVLAESLKRMRRVHSDMRQAADYLLKDSVNTREKPEVKQFDTFVILYDEFVSHLRRIERDAAIADSGIDSLTGLRTRQVMARDLERELERRSRRGRPFCLALARIDNYEQIKTKLSPEEHDRILVEISEIIKLCIRSFDDAYRDADGEFIMCLKQTEMSGGTAGLTRLRKLMEERSPYYVLNGREIRLTLSSCVAEPQPGDTIDDMIGNMRNDLNKYAIGSETMLEYFELSPLQRFVSGLDEGVKKPH